MFETIRTERLELLASAKVWLLAPSTATNTAASCTLPLWGSWSEIAEPVPPPLG